MKPPQHLVWVGGWGFVWRTRRARAVALTSATMRSGTLAYQLGRRGSAFGGLLMVTAFLGDCRMPAAVLLVAQVCKSGVALLASQIGGPLIILAKNKFAPNAIFRVVSCLHILYDLTCLILLKKYTHSLSYMAYRCFAVLFTSD